MSVDRIKELLALMQEHDLVELALEEGDFKVRLKKPGAYLSAMPASMPAMPMHPVAASGPRPAAATAEGAADDADLVPIKSPIVGTFYRAPAPDADPFVKEGDKLGKNAIVCIIEAMKIMNEVKSGVEGTVVKILVENGEPVEYGQAMFLVRP